jgi:glycine cleavage system transcriptional repressor
MANFALMAVGIDRPGNAAAVAGVLVEQGCNLEDTEVAVLRGYSAMMLVVSCPERVTAEGMKAAVEEGTREIGLNVTVCEIDPDDTANRRDPDDAGTPWSVSVYGSDRPGIVFEVTRLLARAGINITGMKTRTHGPAGFLEYTMSLDVQVPPDVDGADVAAGLDSLAGRLNCACSMRPNRRSDL